MSIAIVTGASSGIGRDFVRLMNEYIKVDEIWAIARREQRLIELKESTDIPVREVPMDLTDTACFDKIADMLKSEGREVSVLINCAGYGKFGVYSDIENNEALGMIDLNCRALVGMTNAVLPFMKEGAKILQICSIASFQPLPLMSVYAASKVFVLNYSRALSVELKARKITVTALCPGWVDTDFFATATDTKNPKAVTKYDFIVTPERVARQGLKAMIKGKLISIVSLQNKMLYIINKILPVKLVMNVFVKTQK